MAGVAAAAIFTAGVGAALFSGSGGWGAAVSQGASWLKVTGQHIYAGVKYPLKKAGILKGKPASAKGMGSNVGISAPKSAITKSGVTIPSTKLAGAAPQAGSVNAAALAPGASAVPAIPSASAFGGSAGAATAGSVNAAALAPSLSQTVGVVGQASARAASLSNPAAAAGKGASFWKASQPYLAPVLVGTGMGLVQAAAQQGQQDAALENWRRQLEITTPPIDVDRLQVTVPDGNAFARNIESVHQNKQRLMSPLLATV